jgi:HK97 family phage major capsid protein
LMTKAVVTAGSTLDEAWAKPLVASGIAAEALSLLRGLSIVAQVAGAARRVPFGLRVPIDATTALLGDWIPEGAPTPAVALTFGSVDPLEPTKMGCLVALTRELVLSGEPTAEATVRSTLLGTLAKTIDTLFLDPARAAAAGRPASITNGAPTVPSTGTTAAAIQADLAAMVAAITTSGGALTWIMRKKTLATIAGALGTVSGLPASLWGLPVVTSDNAPPQVTLADMAAILLADDGEFAVAESFEATPQLNSTPDAPASASTVYFPLFQMNAVALRAIRWIHWVRVVPGAVVYMPVTFA